MSHVISKWVMSQINAPCHIYMRHVTYEWVMQDAIESCHIWMHLDKASYIWMRQVKYVWVMSNMPNMNRTCHRCLILHLWWGIQPRLAVCYEGVVFITNTRRIIYPYHGCIPFHTWYNSIQHLRLNFAANLTKAKVDQGQSIRIRKVAAIFFRANRSSSKAARLFLLDE